MFVKIITSSAWHCFEILFNTFDVRVDMVYLKNKIFQIQPTALLLRQIHNKSKVKGKQNIGL